MKHYFEHLYYCLYDEPHVSNIFKMLYLLVVIIVANINNEAFLFILVACTTPMPFIAAYQVGAFPNMNYRLRTLRLKTR